MPNHPFLMHSLLATPPRGIFRGGIHFAVLTLNQRLFPKSWRQIVKGYIRGGGVNILTVIHGELSPLKPQNHPIIFCTQRGPKRMTPASKPCRKPTKFFLIRRNGSLLPKSLDEFTLGFGAVFFGPSISNTSKLPSNSSFEDPTFSSLKKRDKPMIFSNLAIHSTHLPFWNIHTFYLAFEHLASVKYLFLFWLDASMQCFLMQKVFLPFHPQLQKSCFTLRNT